jgi:hypothetical protein
MPEGTSSLAALMRGLVDYAGLFPPAALTMTGAVERYARDRLGPDAASLGRFIVPSARLMEWEQAVAAVPPASRGHSPWRLSALAAPPHAKDLAAVASFNEREATGHDFSARVESVEMKVATAGDVRQAAAGAPARVEMFYECQARGDLQGILAAIQAEGGGAKLRTGGLVPEAIPPCAEVAAFVAGCVAAGVPFKVTAGLHHPVRAEHALTYEPRSPRAVMHGFLNVFVAAILASAHRLDAAQVLPIVEETTPAAFVFTEQAVAWRKLSATVDQITLARSLARGFGSCSFDEPIGDLEALGAYL